MRKITASLDLGSNSIKLVVGEMFRSKLNILAALNEPSKGIKNGLIVNEELFLECLRKLFKRCEEIIGIKISKVIVSIPSVNAEFLVSDGDSEVLHDDGVIVGEDIISAIVSSSSNVVQSNMDVINVMPTVFKIDGSKLVTNPKNNIGKHLSVKSVIGTTSRTITRPIISCLAKLSVEVLDFSFGAVGDYYSIKNESYDKNVGVVLNLGEDLITLSVINKGVLTNTKVLELGGKNIDHDISFIYKISLEEARRLKNSLALAHKRMAVASDYEIVKNKLGEDIKINQFELSDIVMSRLLEMLKITKKQINHLTKKEISYIMVTGGLTELVDFSLILDEVIGKNVILGKIEEIGARSNIYCSSIGLIKYYYDKMKLVDKDYSIFSIDEQKTFSGLNKKSAISESSILGKLYGYFFDN